MQNVRPYVLLAAVALVLSACDGGDEGGGQPQSPSGGGTGSISCGSADQEVCDLLGTVATYLERMAAECGGAYAVPAECTAPIYYDDVETYAAQVDGVDLPGSSVYLTVNSDQSDYVASVAVEDVDGTTLYCALSGSDPVVSCEPL